VSIGADTVPPVGAASDGQFAGTHVGAFSDHVPSSWQVRVDAGTAPKPAGQLYVATEP
jgi:hypothetical protein